MCVRARNEYMPGLSHMHFTASVPPERCESEFWNQPMDPLDDTSVDAGAAMQCMGLF